VAKIRIPRTLTEGCTRVKWFVRISPISQWHSFFFIQFKKQHRSKLCYIRCKAR